LVPCNLRDVWEAEVAEAFVDDDADGVGQVEAADVFAQDGNLVQAVGVLACQVVGESHGLFAKDEEHVVAVVDVAIGLVAFAGEEGKMRTPVGGHEVFEALVCADVEVLPIVQPRSLQAGVRDFESKGLDQVEGGAGSEAEAADVASIGGDFRLHEYDVESHDEVGWCGVSPAEVAFSCDGEQDKWPA